jgi:prepilin-type N-terminal cleavage/methylation domain-containing protein
VRGADNGSDHMPMKDERGFTLVELTVAMGVTVILMGAVYMAVNSAQRHSSGIERKVTAQQDVKPALDLMAMEIGMASYNPNATRGNWLLASDCSTVSPNLDYKGIQEATANTLTVEMDINADCTVDNDPICMRNYTGNLNPNEVIRYNYDPDDTANLYITRRVNCGPSDPFLGDTVASGHPRTVRVINNTAGTGNMPIPVFRYYDGTGAEIFPTTADQTSIPAIRRIAITLAVETENVDPNTNERRRLIYSTSVIPRNHAIN